MAGLNTFEAGDVLFSEGEEGVQVFFIMNGELRVSKTLHNGEEEELARLGEGDIVGEMAILDNRPRTATVTALARTEVMVVDKDNFLSSMEQQPQLAISFLKLLAGRIDQMNEKWRDALAEQST